VDGREIAPTVISNSRCLHP